MKKKTRKRSKESLEDLVPEVNTQRLRIALYTHDTFGLGHVRRSLHIIRSLANRLPRASIMLITGSPALSVFKDLPQHVDIVKIPTVVKSGARGSRPPHLLLSVLETTHLRSRIIKETVLAFAPDVFIVDNFPLGSQSELLTILQSLKSLPTKTILGLRDILDSPDTVKADWNRQGIYDVLEDYYDKILVYGNKDLFDVIEEYSLPTQIAEKVRYCGYLTDTSPVKYDPEKVRCELGVKGPFILVTGGGGGDAFPLIDMFLKTIPQLPDMYSVILTGPLMGVNDRNKLEQQIGGNPKIIFRNFCPDIRTYIKAADVVLTMCGYNMAAEILMHNAKAIVVPRTWKYGEHAKRYKTSEEREQIIRAQILARFGFIDLIEPEKLTVDQLFQKINEVMGRKERRRHVRLNINGLDSAVEEILKTVLFEKECNNVQ